MARILFLLEDMFEDAEFRGPYDAMVAAGHDVVVAGTEEDKEVVGKKGDEAFVTEVSIDAVRPSEFDALVIPGGYSPDKLRTHPKMVSVTREMILANKPVAAICHAGSLLAEADVLRGRKVTSWPSIKTDLINAGASWTDEEVVEDGNLITSRRPSDIAAFSAAVLRHLAEGSAEAKLREERGETRPD